MKRVVCLAVLAACGSSPATPDPSVHVDARAIDTPPRPIDAAADAPPDAAGPDLSCLGHAPPTTAPDPLPVEGKLFSVDHYDVTPVTGATVVLRRRGNDAVIAQTTTAADGSFTMSVVSGGAPVDGYFTVAADGYRATRVDPGNPLSGGENALMLVASDAELARWYAAAGTTYSPGVGTLVTASVDCARHTLDGSTLTIAPSAGVTYYDAPNKQWAAGLTASTNGFALVTGAATSVTATAAIGATSLPSHAIAVPANRLTSAVLTPRS
ncbi:MAG: hypothetical protein JO257_30150 [Deltaproteobacteria bacterium]|nr:hypothetical protein [Deltaproteobacteria bacterium]